MIKPVNQVNRMQLMSFKVSDEIAAQLESIKGDEDSISLVAKRILLETIGTANRKTPVEEKIDLILQKLEELNLSKPSQFITVQNTVKPSQAQIERPACIHCGFIGNHKNMGIRNNKRRWQCVKCKKTFNVGIEE
jgi:ribosomal protein S27AE